nr:ATP-binding protein [uncultured Rhodococcus sp.]
MAIAKSRPCPVSAQSAVWTPGAPSSASMQMPLSSDSAGRPVAATAARRAVMLGCIDATVTTVHVGGDGGMEAAARRARYAALETARGDAAVLIAHTLDDQAETVLLGLARGSGPRSIAGMMPWDSPWGRPLLGVRRAVTRQACAELGFDPYEDPQNVSADFTRVRLRHEVLPLLEDVLGGGVAQALGRTATQLREDGDVLDALADDLLGGALAGDDLDVTALIAVPVALRRRVLRSWLLGAGATGLSDKQLRLIDDLVGGWRGQGGVAVGGGPPGARLVVGRRRGTLALELEWSLRNDS